MSIGAQNEESGADAPRDGIGDEAPRPDMGSAGICRHFRKSLRNPNINYRNGWFFVTTQVAHNKCILGAIAQDRCILTPLGEAVRDYWLSMPAKHPELELDEFVVMPNHFHAILRIHFRATNKEQHLGYLMSRFKGGTGYIYGKMKCGLKPAAPIQTSAAPIQARAPNVPAAPIQTHALEVPAAPQAALISECGASAPLAPDIGDHLWQFDYWDDLITSADELENQRRYIRGNPGNWTHDRFGPCTEHSFGNLDLLSAPGIAFVASQGFGAATLRPRLFGAKAPRGDIVAKAPRPDIKEAVIISTFTSAQEREALRRALAKGRRVIAVLPQGLPAGAEAPRSDTDPRRSDTDPRRSDRGPRPECALGSNTATHDIWTAGVDAVLLAAASEGRALLLSPQPSGSRLNKKVATWCNEYVLRHASEIWTGDISEGGMLHALLRSATSESPARQPLDARCTMERWKPTSET